MESETQNLVLNQLIDELLKDSPRLDEVHAKMAELGIKPSDSTLECMNQVLLYLHRPQDLDM